MADRQKASVLIGGLIVAVLLFAVLPGAAAQAQGTGTPIDLAIVLDDSDSMEVWWTLGGDSKFPPTDPDYLRYSAARLLVSLLEEGDRVFLATFGSGVQALAGSADCVASKMAQVSSLTGCRMQQVSGYESIQAIVGSIEPPSLEKQGTRIDLGYALASHVLRTNREEGRPQYILFLTDGTPTQSGGEGKPPEQKADVRERAVEDRARGIYTYAIGLCSAEAGCNYVDGDLLRDMAGSEERVKSAQTADELVRIFSQILSDLKPGYYVTGVPANADDNLELWTREEQGVTGLHIVLAGDMTELRCDRQPVWRVGQEPAASSWELRPFGDDNIKLLSLNSQKPLVGRPWEVCASGASLSEAFAVVRSSTLPVVAFPPAAVAADPASPHYYPADQDVLLISQVLRSGSPAADQSVTSHVAELGTKALPAGLSRQGFLYWTTLVPPAGEFDVTLQVGSDEKPLRLEREYHLAAQPGLPRLQVVSPTSTNPGLIDGRHARLAVSMPAGSGATDLSVDAYVLDVTNPETPLPVYEARLACTELACVDETFVPEAGYAYAIYFVATAQSQGLWFGDWATTHLSTSPMVVIEGLPDVLDVLGMESGWPISVSALSPTSLGRLQARLDLWRTSDGARVTDVRVPLSLDLSQGGQRTTVLNFTGLDTLRADAYTGDLTFFLEGGAQANILPPSRAVSFDLTHLTAELLQPAVDFAPVAYWLQGEPPPAVGELSLPVEFASQPFRIFASDVSYESVECQGIELRVLPAERADDGSYRLPLRAVLPDRLAPGTCKGRLQLGGTLPYATLKPTTAVDWSLRVEVPVRIDSSGTLKFGDVSKPGSESTQYIQVHMPGRLYPLELSLESSEAGRGTLPPAGSLLVTPGQCERDKEGDCKLPITLKVATKIPAATFTGDIIIGVPGLDKPDWRQRFEVRKPSFLEAVGTWLVMKVLIWIWPRGPWGTSLRCLLPWSVLALVLLALRVWSVRRRRAEEDRAALEQLSKDYDEIRKRQNGEEGAPPPPLLRPGNPPGDTWGRPVTGSGEWGEGSWPPASGLSGWDSGTTPGGGFGATGGESWDRGDGGWGGEPAATSNTSDSGWASPSSPAGPAGDEESGGWGPPPSSGSSGTGWGEGAAWG